jgi:hypothetical protein
MMRLDRARLAAREDLATAGGLWLALRMVVWALVLPVLKHAIPIARLAPVMWSDRKGPTGVSPAHVIRLAGRISRAIPTRDNCLERSLLAYRFLSMAGEDPRLVLGVKSSDGGLSGHAWLTLDGTPVYDPVETPRDFPPLVVFGSKGERELTATP